MGRMERLLESIEPGELCQLLCRRICEYFEGYGAVPVRYWDALVPGADVIQK
jgi:hypothetical protein